MVIQPSQPLCPPSPAVTEVDYPSQPLCSPSPAATEVDYPSQPLCPPSPAATEVDYLSQPLCLPSPAVTEVDYPSQPLCPPSPAPTEVDYPESQDIINFIQAKGIRVHDYAYPSPSTHHLSPVPEIFNQYRGLAEAEYRWSQSHRTYPIQGKTLSRLIDMGWIGQAELSARAAPMDLEELTRHNARQPVYPWKPLRWTTIPTAEERKELIQCTAVSSYLYQWDNIRAEAEFQEMRRLRLERETEQVEERIKQREGREGRGKDSMGHQHKRQLEADDSNNDRIDREPSVFLEGTEPKRKRFSEEPDDFYLAFLIPSKQYPAALHTYDLEIYPEAAYAVRFSSQLQPRAMPPRIDTPPFNKDNDTKHKLVHPKRQLNRTQTYMQL